nr:hypothetical protein [uncultured Desulfobacter sp.]
MEDISKELEREIAQIKPAPHKMRKENTILIINDFGEIRSGAFLKVLIYFFLAISLVGGLGFVVFYQLYSRANNQNVQLKSSQEVLKKKVDRLTGENEILMARLVVTGNAAELKALTSDGKIGQDPPNKEKPPEVADATPDSKVAKGKRVDLDDKNSAPSRPQSVENADGPVEELPETSPDVSIGAFSFSQGSNAQVAVVRFNIKNTAQDSKEISGRIFCVLKPKGTTPDKWVVIPKSAIVKSGVPGPYKKGHYFSISNFKPMKFTINTSISPQDFSEVSVFIFDETEKLLLKTAFKIGQNKQS